MYKVGSIICDGTYDIVELATEVAQVYFDDRLPVHSLVLPNGNLEDTMNFIKWNMEERLVSFVVIREMNLLTGTPGAAM